MPGDTKDNKGKSSSKREIQKLLDGQWHLIIVREHLLLCVSSPPPSKWEFVLLVSQSYFIIIYWLYERQITQLVVFLSLYLEEPHLDLADRTVHYPEILDFEWDSITTGRFRVVSFGMGMVGKMGTHECWSNIEWQRLLVVPNYHFLPQ